MSASLQERWQAARTMGTKKAAFHASDTLQNSLNQTKTIIKCGHPKVNLV
jgi:hypothetical protein